jgi:serine/threonine protein phosphatase 1
MERKLVLGDVHGMFTELTRLLAKIGFNPVKDSLTVLGDYIDRGPCSMQVLELFMDLKRSYASNVTLLKGNHEDLCIKGYADENIFGSNAMALWIANGGNRTIESFHGSIPPEFLEFMAALPVYAEDDNFIFVHGGVDPYIPLTCADPLDLLWNRSPLPHYSGKIVVVGHSIHEEVTFYPESNTLCLDTGACRPTYGGCGKLSCVDLTNKKVHWITTGSAEAAVYRLRDLELSHGSHCLNN